MRIAGRFILALLAASWSAVALFLLGLSFAEGTALGIMIAVTPLVLFGLPIALVPTLLFGAPLYSLAISNERLRHPAVWCLLGLVVGLLMGGWWNEQTVMTWRSREWFMLGVSGVGGGIAALVFRAIAWFEEAPPVPAMQER